MFKKIFFTLFSFLLVFYTIYPATVKAQAPPWYSQDFDQWYIKVYDKNVSPPDEIFGERYTAAQVQWVFYGIGSFFLNSALKALNKGDDAGVCVMTGTSDIGSCFSMLLSDKGLNQKESEDRGVLATLFEPTRFGGINYIRQSLSRFEVIPSTYAQGFGFSALNPIQTIWKAFRNISFALFVVIILILSFMIMFRVKLSPQTVVTAQSAIPRVIIALILVSFSYAIAGLLVDFMYVIIGILAWVMTQTGMFNQTWSQAFKFLTDGAPIGAGILGVLIFYMGLFSQGVTLALFSPSGIMPYFVSIGLSFVLSPFIQFAGYFIVVFVAFKTLVVVLKTYVQIIISIIFAPLIIGAGALLPGVGFGQWAKSLFFNLMTYPVIGALVYLALLFVSSSYAEIGAIMQNQGMNFQPLFGASASAWYPPLTFGSPTGSYNPLPILLLMASFAIFAAIPKVGDLIASMASGKPFDYGSGLGVALGPLAGVGSRLYGMGMGGYGMARGAAIREIGYRVGEAGFRMLPPGGRSPSGLRGVVARGMYNFGQKTGGMIVDEESHSGPTRVRRPGTRR